MNYTEMLNKLIAESGMSQKEISIACKEIGEEVSTTYLSALKNTDGKMASDNISRVIAKACNAKHEEILVVQAYLDKAPQFIINFLEEVRNVHEQSTNFMQLALAKLPHNLKGIGDEIEKMNSIKSLAEFICEYKGNMAADKEEFEDAMKAMTGQEIDIAAQLKQKLIENEDWLLIPLKDMGKSQIVTNAEAEYIKKTLKKNLS